MSEQPGAGDPFEVPGASPPPEPWRGPPAPPAAYGSPPGSYPPGPYPPGPYPTGSYPPAPSPSPAAAGYGGGPYGPPPWAYGPGVGAMPPASFGPRVPATRRGVPAYDEAQPYHRMLRTRNYGWWRPVIGLAVLAVTYVVLQTLVLSALLVPAVVSGRFSLEDLSTDATSLTAELVSDPVGLAAATLAIATGIVAAALALLAGHQLRPGWLHSVIGRMRWGFLTACLGLGAIAVVTHLAASSIVAGVAGGGDVPIEPGRPQLLLALVALLLVPLQAAGEEYVFRGYAMQALGAWLRRPWLPILLTSLVFSAIHLGDAASSAWFFMFGVVAAYLTVRTGGLEAAIGLHVAWNTVTLMLLALLGADSGEAISSRGDSSWVLPLISVPVFIGYALLVLWLARRMGIDAQTRPSPAPSPWPAPAYVESFGQPPGPR